MSILREKQIREILDADNFFNRVVLERDKRGVKNYQENIKMPQVLDKNILDSNNNNVTKFINDINDVYLKLRIFRDSVQFFNTLSNTQNNEYKKYIETLNITKIFMDWDRIMEQYNNPALNNITKEAMTNNLLKIEPWLSEIVRILKDKNLKFLVGLWLYQNSYINEDTLKEKYLMVEKFPFVFMDRYETDNFISKIYNAINSLELIREHIETLAFYESLLSQFKNNQFKKIDKMEVSKKILDIINLIKIDTNNNKLIQAITKKFDGTLIPELAPYFKKNNFDSYYKELEAMDGIIPPAVVDPYDAYPFYPSEPDYTEATDYTSASEYTDYTDGTESDFTYDIDEDEDFSDDAVRRAYAVLEEDEPMLAEALARRGEGVIIPRPPALPSEMGRSASRNRRIVHSYPLPPALPSEIGRSGTYRRRGIPNLPFPPPPPPPPYLPDDRIRRGSTGSRPLTRRQFEELKEDNEEIDGKGKPKTKKEKLDKNLLNKLLKYPNDIVIPISETLPKIDREYIDKMLGRGKYKGKPKIQKNKKPICNFNDEDNEMFYDELEE